MPTKREQDVYTRCRAKCKARGFEACEVWKCCQEVVLEILREMEK